MPDFVRSDPQYVHMNGGAHRRPAPQIAAPALTWQLGFWRSSPKIPKLSDDAWYYNIDLTLLHLFKHFTADAKRRDYVSPNLEVDTLYLFHHKIDMSVRSTYELVKIDPENRSVRHNIFSLAREWDGIQLTITARRHLEYFVILFSADFSETDHHPGPISPEMQSIWRHFSRLHDIAVERHEAQGSSGPIAVPLDPADQAEVDLTHQQVVDAFQRYVTSACQQAFKRQLVEKPQYGLDADFRSCGTVFADFFGLIFGLGLSNGRLARVSAPQLEDGQRFTIPAQVQSAKFEEKAIEVVDAIWPIVRRTTGDADREALYGKPEYTVSLFNSGKTIYLSSLGRLLPDGLKHERQQVIYTLVVSYPSKWRLGRLIDRINTLGLLRLAALRDLRKLNDASNDINAVFAKLRDARDGATPRNAREIEEAFQSIGKDIDVGLQYRVGRSKYYVQLYQELTSILDPWKVDGFQLYTNFVRGRLFDAFDFIDRVGRRYDELQSAIIFDDSARRQAVTNRLREATARNTEATTNLLTAAEFFAVVPIMYYAGGALSHVFPEIEFEKASALSALNGEKVYYLVGLAIAIALALLSHHMRTRRQGAREPKRSSFVKRLLRRFQKPDSSA